MSRFGLCGGSYQSQSPNADPEFTENWLPEAIESQQGKTAIALYPTPGLSVFVNLPGMVKVWLILYVTIGASMRAFAVAEDLQTQYLFEFFANKTQTQRSPLGAAGTQPSITYNNANQIAVASAGRVFVMNILTNLISEVDTTTGNAIVGSVARIGYSDTYGLVLIKNSQKFQISNLNDLTSWSPLDIAAVSKFQDNVLSMIVDHSEPWFLGAKQSIVYYDSGDPNFPFSPIPGAVIENGTISLSPPVKLDNSIFWVGGDERGSCIGWRASGYTPTRVTNHAVEMAWQGYAVTSDLLTFSLQYQGHSLWVVMFPTARKTWVFDVATGLWHNWANFDGMAHLAQCHEFAFGQHLMGARNSGNIYLWSIQNQTDNGQPIQRVRRSPIISMENEWLFHSKLELDCEVGLGPEPPLLDPEGNPRGPQVFLRYSDDSGHTWSDFMARDLGLAGEFRKRVIWWRLGRSRNRVYEISYSDPVPLRIIDGYVEASPGFGPSERLTKQLGKVA